MATELSVAANPFVLYRCGDCNSRRWMKDGRIVAICIVTAAMSKDATRARRQAPRGVRSKILPGNATQVSNGRANAKAA